MIVALAVVVRGALDGDSDDEPSSSGPLVVACDPDLRAACEALDGVDVRIEDSASTAGALQGGETDARSEEHTSELQSLMRNSYAVFCLKKKKHNYKQAASSRQ